MRGRAGTPFRQACVIHSPPSVLRNHPYAAPKDFLGCPEAARVCSVVTPLCRATKMKAVSFRCRVALANWDLVSREEFDSQMVVLARTRARLESLEASAPS